MRLAGVTPAYLWGTSTAHAEVRDGKTAPAKWGGDVDVGDSIRFALDALHKKGGGRLDLPGGLGGISGRIEIPDGVSIEGTGSAPRGSKKSGFRALAEDAQIAFGDRSTPNVGGRVSNFVIDGARIAVKPLYIGRVLQRTFQDIDVNNAAGNAVTIEEAQNCRFLNFNVEKAGGAGMVLDGGCGGLLFLGTEINACGQESLRLQRSYPASGLVYSMPNHIRFVHSIFERSASGTALVHWCGSDITFDTCIFAGHGPNDLVRIVSDRNAGGSIRVRFIAPSFVGTDSSTGMAVDDHASVIVSDTARLNHLATGFRAGARARIDIDSYEASAVGAVFADAATRASVRHRLSVPLAVETQDGPGLTITGEVRSQPPSIKVMVGGRPYWIPLEPAG